MDRDLAMIIVAITVFKLPTCVMVLGTVMMAMTKANVTKVLFLS